jgi:hypothetical protein
MPPAVSTMLPPRTAGRRGSTEAFRLTGVP